MIIINPHDVQARRTHKNPIRRHMSPHSPSMIHADRSPVRDNHRRWFDVFFHGDDPARTATIPPINSSTLPGLDEFPLNLYQMIRVELVRLGQGKWVTGIIFLPHPTTISPIFSGSISSILCFLLKIAIFLWLKSSSTVI